MSHPAAHTPEPAKPVTAAELETLRQEIDGIDEQIVHLLAERHGRVCQVIAFKQAKGLPVYHPAREENLISQRRAQARQAGLDPDHIEGLFRSILRQSRVRQTLQVTRNGVRPGARVLIVGGAGQMGQYFTHWFQESGYVVQSLDVADWPNAAKLCRDTDLALVSVPIQTVSQVIAQLAPFLPPHCVLADITSIKKPPLEAMLAAHPGPVLGLHPLFGPNAASMDKQVVVVTPGRDDAACQWLLDQFSAWGNIVLNLDATEHDDVMSIVQAVRHFAAFSFGQFLYRRQVDIGRTLEFSSPIYRLEMGMIGRLFAQDGALYANILFASPERRATLKDFINSMNDNLEMLETGDTAQFCAEFRRIAEWFGPFSEQALRESNFLIEKLVERF